jgi:hypothetical protein
MDDFFSEQSEILKISTRLNAILQIAISNSLLETSARENYQCFVMLA